jgi:hypothetical protein
MDIAIRRAKENKIIEVSNNINGMEIGLKNQVNFIREAIPTV